MIVIRYHLNNSLAMKETHSNRKKISVIFLMSQRVWRVGVAAICNPIRPFTSRCYSAAINFIGFSDVDSATQKHYVAENTTSSDTRVLSRSYVHQTFRL